MLASIFMSAQTVALYLNQNLAIVVCFVPMDPLNVRQNKKIMSAAIDFHNAVGVTRSKIKPLKFESVICCENIVYFRLSDMPLKSNVDPTATSIINLAASSYSMTRPKVSALFSLTVPLILPTPDDGAIR